MPDELETVALGLFITIPSWCLCMKKEEFDYLNSFGSVKKLKVQPPNLDEYSLQRI